MTNKIILELFVLDFVSQSKCIVHLPCLQVSKEKQKSWPVQFMNSLVPQAEDR